jgi:hypothetical protein
VKSFPGGPVLIPGMGSKLATLKVISPGNPSILSGGLPAAITVLKSFPGGPVLLGGNAAPIIAGKLARFTGHS